MNNTNRTLAIDALLAPYESRNSQLSGDEVAIRRKGLEFGWELSRIQGATMTVGWKRLLQLYTLGKIDRQEYRRLGLELARLGALHVAEPNVDVR